MAGHRSSLIIVCCLLLLYAAFSAPAQPLHIPLDTPELEKAFSEFNHHLAGYFLIAIGLSAFLSVASPRLAFMKRIWPLLFIIAGLYLALAHGTAELASGLSE